MSLYIGLLSGTSVDAIDGILVKWEDNKPKIVSTCNQQIPPHIRQQVFDLALSGTDEIEQLRILDYDFAHLFSTTVQTLCLQADVAAKDVRAIGSHGQTVRHYPPMKEAPGYSLQIGDPNIIAEQTGITTVADFRRRDIAAGGHGAPLAPALHHVLFGSSTKNRVILNTGGIANITYLPIKGDVIGFDTGPANGLMDSWCQRHTGHAFDSNGDWAASGTAQTNLLQQLLQHPYFKLPIPKSTGRETFNLPWLEQQLMVFDGMLNAKDVQATLLLFTVETIAQAIETYANNTHDIYICGGGAHNLKFCEQLQQRLSPRYFSSTSALGVDPDWVEALAFSWLAKQTMEQSTGNLPSVTGAKKAVVLGGIYQA
jgi:anhydro-N-acetylmuramic acid kinase